MAGKRKYFYLFGTRIWSEEETALPLAGVHVSPTKKPKPTTYLDIFGTRIWLEESSYLDSKQTLIPLADDVPISPTKKKIRTNKNTDDDSKTPSSENPNANPKEVTCAPRNEEQTAEENQTGVQIEVPINTWTIEKTLTPSDINGLHRLMIKISLVEKHIMTHLSEDDQKRIQQGNGVKVKVCDHDTNTEHGLVFKRLINSSRSYVFNGDWVQMFVQRRDLKQGDQIGLFWGCDDYKLHFCVLSRANPN